MTTDTTSNATQASYSPTVYGSTTLGDEAKWMVKRLGRLIRWEIRIHDSGRVGLWALYRPKGQPAGVEAWTNQAL